MSTRLQNSIRVKERPHFDTSLTNFEAAFLLNGEEELMKSINVGKRNHFSYFSEN